ncbi:MAG: ArnT family glycosyltransferase [Planctomycetota bacterium]
MNPPIDHRNRALAIAAPLIAGLLIRVFSLIQNLDYAHGDVNGDALVAESIARGYGFWMPWEEATTIYDDPLGKTAETWGHPADSHGPLWSLLAAPFVIFTKSGYLACQILSLICGVLAIEAARRLFQGFAEGELGRRAGLLAAWACAVSLPISDYSGNGSLYAGQILGTLLLPLVARQFVTIKGAALCGAALGLFYLLSYQAGLLIPLFTIAAFVSFGIRGAFFRLVVAGAVCLAVTLPWFIRNYLIWGDPLFSSNAAFFTAKVGSVLVDLAGQRPGLVIQNESVSILESIVEWARFNVPFVIAAIPASLAGFAWFSLGGIQRMTFSERFPRVRFDSLIVLSVLLMLFITAVICPQPRTRNIVPMIPIFAGAAALELALGARVLWLSTSISAALGILVYLQTSYPDFCAPLQADCIIAALPLATVIPFYFIRSKKHWVPWILIVSLVCIGAFRVWLAGGLDRLSMIYSLPDVVPQIDKQFVPTRTFYESINSPYAEGMSLAILRESAEACRALEAAGCELLLGRADTVTLWNRKFLSTRGTVELSQLPQLIEFFGVDGFLIWRPWLERQQHIADWVQQRDVKRVYEGTLLVGCSLK